MLKLKVPQKEFFDPKTETFMHFDGAELTLEHSLVALSKWESKWKVYFLGNKDITPEQFIDYVRCMTITQNPNPLAYLTIANDRGCLQKISEYMEDPMTATTINERSLGKSNGGYSARKIITSELIYYWMTALKIPFECQKWHINRLLTLIKVASIERQPPKKMNKREAMAQQRSLNAARRAKHHSKG